MLNPVQEHRTPNTHPNSDIPGHTMTDLPTLLAQLFQHAHSTENIVNAIHVPEPITQTGHSHCKEYLDMAMEHMIKMGEIFGSILAQHPHDLQTTEVQTAAAKQDLLITQFKSRSASLWERTPTAKLLTPTKEASIQANIKYDQLRIDIEQLNTSLKAHLWGEAEDHIIALGMRSRPAWRSQHATISKEIIEIKGLADIHDLVNMQERIENTESEILALFIRMNVTIFEIEASDTKQGLYTDRQTKACPVKLPTYSGLISEDFITFKDRFHNAAIDNKIPRRDQVDKLRERLTGRALANLPANGIRDIEHAWEHLETTFGDPYTSLTYRLTKIQKTPALTDKVVRLNPTQAADWYLAYENAVKEILHLGTRGPQMEAVAYNIPTLYTISSKLPYTLSDKIYDIEETGRAKLDKIIGIISKARTKANARATDIANNASTSITPPTP